jgi:hypothetical protein
LEDYETFGAIGFYYRDFRQISDEEMIETLRHFPATRRRRRSHQRTEESQLSKLRLVLAVEKRINGDRAAASSDIRRAECLMVSNIGAPVTDPSIVQIKVAIVDRIPASRFEERAAEIVAKCLGNIPHLIDEFVAGRIEVF